MARVHGGLCQRPRLFFGPCIARKGARPCTNFRPCKNSFHMVLQGRYDAQQLAHGPAEPLLFSTVCTWFCRTALNYSNSPCLHNRHCLIPSVTSFKFADSLYTCPTGFCKHFCGYSNVSLSVGKMALDNSTFLYLIFYRDVYDTL